jgi:hypothetical protein
LTTGSYQLSQKQQQSLRLRWQGQGLLQQERKLLQLWQAQEQLDCQQQQPGRLPWLQLQMLRLLRLAMACQLLVLLRLPLRLSAQLLLLQQQQLLVVQQKLVCSSQLLPRLLNYLLPLLLARQSAAAAVRAESGPLAAATQTRRTRGQLHHTLPREQGTVVGVTASVAAAGAGAALVTAA